MERDLAAHIAHLEDMVEMYQDHIASLENILRQADYALEKARRERHQLLRQRVDFRDMIVRAVELQQPKPTHE